jgi:cell division protein FtsN
MPTASQDTEITLGTGRMLAIFFTLVLVCAFFFGIGFSLGRKTSAAMTGGPLGISSTAPATIVRPSPGKNDAGQPAQANDFGFYKAVGQKSADTGLTQPPDAKTQPATANASPAGTEAPPKDAADPGATAAAGAGYYVQVAAVSRQEDAESLVEALKKKQYPAFMANNPAADKFYRVQVGPYAELKEAEAMRARLISDGYNPIVKK